MKPPSAIYRAARESRWRHCARNRTFRRALLAGGLALQCLLPGRGFALDPAKSVFQFNCQNWTRHNGLPADKISAITQSRDGYLWLGTQNGLVRFDGLDFKVIPITLPQAHGHDVRKLARARDGGVWFAINLGGFGRYDGQNFSAAGDERWAQPSMSANAIMEARDGALWMGEDAGFGRWVKGNPEESLLDEVTTGPVISFCEDPAGKIWLGTAEHGLFSWAGGKLVPFPDARLKQRNLFAMAVDAENQLWLGTGGGLFCYAANAEPKAVGSPGYEVKTLLVDRHGVLWVGTTGMGLARYQHGQLTYFRKSDGLGSDNITALFEDAEGSLWVGTRDGLSQLSDVKFPIFSSQEGIGTGSCRSVVASKEGGVWMATDNGVSFFDGRNVTNYTAGELLPNGYVKLVFQTRNGEIYAEDGDKNINIFSGGRLLNRLTNSVWTDAFAEDDQSVVVGMAAKLSRIQNGQLRPYSYQNGAAPDFYWINSLWAAKDGSLWVASNNGLFRIQHGAFEQWSTDNGLADKKVLWVCEDADGSIWAGLSTGMARVKNGQFKLITPEDGLPDARIYTIVPDDQGFFWCDSGRGIFRTSRQGLNAFADGKVDRVECDVFDGLESVKSNDRTDQENSGCKTLDGRVWFPCPWGVVMIDPAHLPTNRIAPPVHIQSVLANGKEFDPDQKIAVSPGQGELEVQFTALSFIAPQKIRFRYQLAGYDKNWVDSGGRRLAFYTNLKPGRYTFRITAANADGIGNETGDDLAIELRPHFYQTAWFLLAAILLAGGVLAGIYAWRVRHLEHRQRALQQARDRLEAEVQHRTAELAAANASLKTEVGERKRTMAELAQRTQALEAEIEERKRMEQELESIHKRLLDISRQAGMAEVATNVLHNVGNVLNSVNVSAALVADNTKKSKVSYLTKVAALMDEHTADLGAFMTADPKGRQVPGYLSQLAAQLAREQEQAIKELELLRQNIEHIKDIVAMQQSYAKISGVTETVKLADLVEDALSMNAGALARHEIELLCEYSNVPPITVEKHKVLQILVNLIRNAKYACDDSGRKDKKLTLRIGPADGGVQVVVQDNGIGIAPENLTRIFNHGFTTRKQGHGFGLHSGALAAREMGGALTAHSEGHGQGAVFVLKLPLNPPEMDL